MVVTKKKTRIINDSNDHFLMVKKVYIDYGYHKITNFVNIFFIIVYLIANIFQVYFLITHWSVDVLARYSTALLISTYILQGMIFPQIYRTTVLETYNSFTQIAWPSENVSKKVQKKLEQKAKATIVLNVILLSYMFFLAIVNVPFFGEPNDLVFSTEIFREIFGKWSWIPSFLYYLGFPLTGYSAVRIFFVFLYGVLHLDVQILLINEVLGKLSCNNRVDDPKFKDPKYQEDIYRKLCLCIKQDVALRDILSHLRGTTKTGLPIFLLLTFLITISLFYNVMTYTPTISNLLRVQMISLTAAIVITIFLYALTGQHVINQTSLVFEELCKCPWYMWNVKTRKIYLTFMLNNVRPIQVDFAGICLNLDFFLTATRGAFSYALVLHRMRGI